MASACAGSQRRSQGPTAAIPFAKDVDARQRGLARCGSLLWALFAASACSDLPVEAEDAGEDAGAAVEVEDSGGRRIAGAGDDTGALDAGVAMPNEDFWVLYGRRAKKPGAGDANDAVLTDKHNPGAIDNAAAYGLGINPLDGKSEGIKLTTLAVPNAGGLSCGQGCKLSQNLKYIAIAHGQLSEGALGYTYELGTLTQKLQVVVGKFSQLKNVSDLHFADHKLYYSTPRNCFRTGKCQYEIRLAMMDGSADDKLLTVMPPDSDPDVLDPVPHTTYAGRFQVSDDGGTLTFLTTTIRSVKLWAWRGGALYQLDYLCQSPFYEGSCVGSGSLYFDGDAVGISPDGKTVVHFAIVDRSLRVRKYELGSPSATVSSNLLTVPAGAAYRESACLHLKPWQHAEVKSRPAFSADGKIVYFLGSSSCAGLEGKAWTDILGLQVDKIGGTISEADFTNFTQNARDNSVNNLWIRDFQLSPQRTFFVFNASPRWGPKGEPASGLPMLWDTEVFVLPIQPKAIAVQITNEAEYFADSPVAHLPLATSR